MSAPAELIARIRANVPAQLRELPVWLLWQLLIVEGDNKPKKVPLYANGSNRSGTLDSPEDRGRLVTFEEAAAALAQTERAAGVGVALGEVPGEEIHVSGIDFDHCYQANELDERVQRAMLAAESYVEKSPSGDGVHILGTGDVGVTKKDASRGGFEIYSRSRFFTVTGEALNGCALSDLTDAARLTRELFGATALEGISVERNGQGSTPADGAVGEGRRNDYLSREAYRLRKTGGTAEQILVVLKAMNEARCRPPLPDAEVEAIARGKARVAADAAAELPPQPPAMNWRALEGRSPPPRTWWIQDWLGPSPTLCSGAGGVGKSMLWQTIGTCLATGYELFGPTQKDLKVLAWFCEDDADEIWRRQVAICEHLSISIATLAERLTIFPRHGCDNTLFDLTFGKPTFTPQFLLLAEQVNDLKPDVLVLDNNGHTYGGNESDRHQVTQFVNGVYGLGAGRPFAPIFLGHVARTPGSEFSGSAAWENACRMRWYMGYTLPDQKLDDDESVDTGIVYLAKRKANYTQGDWRKLRFNGMLLLPEQSVGRRFDSAHRDDLAEAIVLKAMPKLLAAGVLPSDGKTSGDYLPTQIIAKGYGEGHSKKELAAAMNRLMGAGRLRREVVGKYSNRAPRHGLVVVP